MQENLSVLIINQSIDAVGVLVNAALVLGLTAGQSRLQPPTEKTWWMAMASGIFFLTCIGNHVRKTSPGKLRNLRETLAQLSSVILVDYTEDTAPADYQAYASALGSHRGEANTNRTIYVYGPAEMVLPLTKNLSRL